MPRLPTVRASELEGAVADGEESGSYYRVGLLAWTSACRAEKTGSNPVRGAMGPSEGRNEASKTSELGSIPSGPATGLSVGTGSFPCKEADRGVGAI